MPVPCKRDFGLGRRSGHYRKAYAKRCGCGSQFKSYPATMGDGPRPDYGYSRLTRLQPPRSNRHPAATAAPVRDASPHAGSRATSSHGRRRSREATNRLQMLRDVGSGLRRRRMHNIPASSATPLRAICGIPIVQRAPVTAISRSLWVEKPKLKPAAFCQASALAEISRCERRCAATDCTFCGQTPVEIR
jgi:hypothetical protein